MKFFRKGEDEMADFVRRSELWTYDVFPKVIGTEKESTIHIRPFGGENFFPAGSVHEAAITWLDGGHIEHAPASAFRKELDVTANEENGLDISITFPHEGEYRIRIEGENADGDKKSFTFCVYAVSGASRRYVSVYRRPAYAHEFFRRSA